MTDQSSSTVISVPPFAVPALFGKKGGKVKDIEATSGASLRIFKPAQGGAWAQVTIFGSKAATSTACLLIKMAVIHAKAADDTPPPLHYPRDKKAEAQLDVLTFYVETRARAFNTKHPKNSS